MGSYSVPQDVEADDKLIGPFSFRQFVYLVIVAGSVALAWALGTIFVGLAAIPLPVILLFAVLALPLKKDQPMETYLLAIVSFFLKPRKRIWKADGVESLVEITAPKVKEVQFTKDISEDEATKRLAYLSNLADSQGWAIKTGGSSPMRDDLYQEAMGTTDMLDENSRTASNLTIMMDSTDKSRREEVIKNMRESFAKEEAEPSAPPTIIKRGEPGDFGAAPLVVTPFDMQQAVANLAASQPVPTPGIIEAVPPTLPDHESISPDLINLANNDDLSVATIAREAERKTKDEGEVFVSLR